MLFAEEWSKQPITQDWNPPRGISGLRDLMITLWADV